ncbi:MULTISPECIES: hypothetical protein [Chryseobacterium]|uniref:hypothetical protein n=1 Tax=Chryseobacterium sp. R2A-55 TaxID=2744445 RepID=UPI001F489C60|nr:hypothetical protein [Chryseobacterium sp. R2A-55]
MKYIFELILTVIIIFFLWNMLKRLFFNSFYRFPQHRKEDETASKKTKKNLDSKLNWDAETVDYEEVKEDGKE